MFLFLSGTLQRLVKADGPPLLYTVRLTLQGQPLPLLVKAESPFSSSSSLFGLSGRIATDERTNGRTNGAVLVNSQKKKAISFFRSFVRLDRSFASHEKETRTFVCVEKKKKKKKFFFFPSLK